MKNRNIKKKLRLRSYGLANKESKTFLEVKRKSEGIVYKRRITLLEEEALDLVINKKTNSKDQIKRLTDMTNQLVLLSKLEEDDPKRFEFNDFSINEVCNNAVNALDNNFKKEGIKFSSNITGNLTMYGNRNMIDQLLYIFLAIYNPDARLFNCRVGSLYYL